MPVQTMPVLKRVHVLLGCSIVSALAVSERASAQGQSDAIEEVTVTGSRIATRSGMNTPTPVTTVTSVELARMAPGNVIHSLSQLPQFYGNSNPDQPGFFNSSPGAGNLDLRGLGPNRTLTLLSGRRVVPSSRLGSTDINVFPEPLISNIEIVTGGASAAYGTDAVAGVVNFILNTDFEGIEWHAQTGQTDRGDNENYEVSVAFGKAIGQRMHLLLAGDYYDQDGARGYDDRGWYQGWGIVTNPDPNGPMNLIAPNVVSTRYTDGGLINQPGSALDRLMFLPDGSVAPFVVSDLAAVGRGTNSQSIANGGTGYNAGADPYVAQLATESSRNSLFSYLDWEVNDRLTVYFQGLLGENELLQANTPAVMFPTAWQATIYRDNAFLPEDLRQIMIDEGLESFGFSRYASSADLATNRVIISNEMRSATLGFDLELAGGGFFDGWRASAYAQYGENTRVIRQSNWTRTDLLFQALDAVRDPATGEIVCRAKLAGHPDYQDCVPINLFGAGRASQEAINYVTGQYTTPRLITTPLYISSTGLSDDGYEQGIMATYWAGADKVPRSLTTQRMFEFSIDGEAWEGWGAGPVMLAFGASYREESVFQIVEDITNPASDPNIIVRPNDPANGIQGIPSGYVTRPTGFAFSNFPNIKGKLDVKEIFGETLLPLVADRPLVDQLNLSLATRWADYSGSGNINAWKWGLDWTVNDTVRVRATKSRDVRAATLAERLDRQGSPQNVRDPANNNEQVSAGGNVGGNPNLAPEEADTVTFGVVYQPSWADGLAISADWYDIKINGAIGQLTSQRIVDDCWAGAVQLCALIQRDPVTNLILHVDNLYLNINEARVSGADLEVSYSRELNLFGGGEVLGARLFLGWLDENSITNIGVPKFDRVGEVGALDFPEYKITANLSYVRGPLSLFLQQRWIDGGLRRANEVEGIQINDNSIASVRYTDLNIAYEVETSRGFGWEIFGNITNLFDEDPPIAAGFSDFGGAGQTNAGLHDVLGRRYVVGARMRF
jgi:iron complex outermembrane receptor protein